MKIGIQVFCFLGYSTPSAPFLGQTASTTDKWWASKNKSGYAENISDTFEPPKPLELLIAVCGNPFTAAVILPELIAMASDYCIAFARAYS